MTPLVEFAGLGWLGVRLLVLIEAGVVNISPDWCPKEGAAATPRSEEEGDVDCDAVLEATAAR